MMRLGKRRLSLRLFGLLVRGIELRLLANMLRGNRYQRLVSCGRNLCLVVRGK